MPCAKAHRCSQAARRWMETRRTLDVEPQQTASGSHARNHKLVIPAEAPHKKFVLLVGASHLRSIADWIVVMPEVPVPVLPRKPDAVLVQAPSNNLTASRTIHEAAADFCQFLATVCSHHTSQHLCQEYHRVAASMGVKYYPVAEYFPMSNLELWCRDGVHLSDTVGMPILAQLLWMASYMVLEPPVPKPQTPPRQAKCAPSQRIVVKGEVVKRDPSANPFEWSTVRRGRKATLWGCSIPVSGGRFSALSHLVEDVTPPAACVSATSAVPKVRKEPRAKPRQRAAASKQSLQVEAATAVVQVCSLTSRTGTASASVTQEADAAPGLQSTSAVRLPARSVGEGATQSAADVTGNHTVLNGGMQWSSLVGTHLRVKDDDTY
nr:PREDICTED: uncharacterized protein LOC103365813 [Stegastes partitus]